MDNSNKVFKVVVKNPEIFINTLICLSKIISNCFIELVPNENNEGKIRIKYFSNNVFVFVLFEEEIFKNFKCIQQGFISNIKISGLKFYDGHLEKTVIYLNTGEQNIFINNKYYDYEEQIKIPIKTNIHEKISNLPKFPKIIYDHKITLKISCLEDVCTKLENISKNMKMSITKNSISFKSKRKISQTKIKFKDNTIENNMPNYNIYSIVKNKYISKLSKSIKYCMVEIYFKEKNQPVLFKLPMGKNIELLVLIPDESDKNFELFLV
ncbi:PCNA-like domain [Moumouvirus australiensis]|uniref:PCNA-like domain n=1 Tax=Moumouvirus australiensis TaxID=2109587 RepID=A0A2P1EN02_9VIRU|nr:PCNA-like domain [Moumouvirus australiensis]AVL95248.1 PCNA-like domain [Moumouvirus australiensis]